MDQSTRVLPQPRIWRTIGLMLGAGVLLGWASVFLIQVAVRLGLSELAANKIPFLGFATGLAIGFGMQRSRGIKEAVGYISAPLILGAVCWFLAVLLGGLLLGLGASEWLVDKLPIAAFGLGVAIGIVPLFAWGFDVFDGLRRSPGRDR